MSNFFVLIKLGKDGLGGRMKFASAGRTRNIDIV